MHATTHHSVDVDALSTFYREPGPRTARTRYDPSFLTRKFLNSDVQS
jgi:hypothetical protein